MIIQLGYADAVQMGFPADAWSHAVVPYPYPVVPVQRSSNFLPALCCCMARSDQPLISLFMASWVGATNCRRPVSSPLMPSCSSTRCELQLLVQMPRHRGELGWESVSYNLGLHSTNQRLYCSFAG